MILQALKEYYDRKTADPNSDIAPEGFEKRDIPFLVVINPDGTFVNLEDTREQDGKRMIAKTFQVPRSKVRSGSKSYATTFLLWDHVGYLFGYPEGDTKAANQHQTWMVSLNKLPPNLLLDEGVQAVLRFYASPEQIAAVKSHRTWADCVRLPSCNMTFRLAGDILPIPCREAVVSFVREFTQSASAPDGNNPNVKTMSLCLVTGEQGEIAKIHGRTPINKDTKSLVAFQKHAGYDSYGKEQGYNAPVSKSAEFAYTTALNTLLKSNRQRVRVGDATAVFWSAEASTFEDDAFLFFDEPRKDDPDQGTDAVRAIYESIWNGTYSVQNNSTRFYILGLSPNSARIAVRFWHVGTVMETGVRLKQHVSDLSIAHSDKTNPALPIRRLLHSIAPLDDDSKLSPTLAGDMVRSIFEGLPYPETLLQSCILRIRAEQSKKDNRTGKQLPNVTYPRAALIKACLSRSSRYNYTKQEEEMNVSLDMNNVNIGYRLGRLFAALEKIQAEASPNINATIRDRFYGAASSTPVTVFGNLMRLKNHHLAKLENPGRRRTLEILLGEIMSGIADFPAHLALEDQGRFAIGYYHQMQDFYTKKTQSTNKEG